LHFEPHLSRAALQLCGLWHFTHVFGSSMHAVCIKNAVNIFVETKTTNARKRTKQ